MYDIKPLEEEWKKYRKQRRKPWYIGGIIFFMLLIVGITFFGNKEIFTGYFKTIKSNTLTSVKEVKSNVLLDNALERLEIEQAIATVATKEQKTQPLNILVDIPILEDVEATEDKKKKIHIDIIETSSVTAYEDVEKRFYQSHDIDDSLFLAKSYYKKGYYKKAEYWALETNKINENIEESLVIFVKAKAKLGHKNEAISILTRYIDKSNSQEAKNLLFKLKNDIL